MVEERVSSRTRSIRKPLPKNKRGSLGQRMRLVLLVGMMFLGIGDVPTLWALDTRTSLGSTPITNELLVKLAEKITPSVVNVSAIVETRREDPRAPFPFFEDPFFRRFFGEEFERRFPPREKFQQQGTGSGVIVSADGYIITNNHVVAKADEIQVLLADERKFTARVVGTDPKTDLAVIKIEASNLPFLQWGDSSRLKVGEVVLAVGNPFGLNQTVTMGIVSAVGRANVGIVDYEDFIQTDAAINPGNSGGALVNLKGELVGINTAIFSQSGGYMGIGFAIPSRMASIVSKTLIEKGKVIRGWLGVSIQNITQELADQFQVPDTNGVLISNVNPDSPAEQAGLERGDIVRKYDGQVVNDPVHLRTLVAETSPNTTVALTILREGDERTVRINVGEQPRVFPDARGVDEAEGKHALAGVIVENLSPGEAPEDEGVIVRVIPTGSPADRAGLQRGDIILEMNRQPIRDTRDFSRIVRELKREEAVLLVVRRERGVFFLHIKP